LIQTKKVKKGHPMNATDQQALQAIEKALNIKLEKLEKLDWHSKGYVLNEQGKVRDLGLYRCEIKDLNRIIEPLKDLSNLKELYLSNNQISELSGLKDLNKLSTLYLMNNQIQELSALKGLNNLSTLNLGGNQIQELSALKGLNNLSTLNLRNNQIQELSALKGLNKLSTLNLSWNKISELSALKGLNNLSRLDLRNNKIRELSGLKDLRNLQNLYLENNPLEELPAWITDFDMEIQWTSGGFKGISFYNNPLKSPPIEVVKQGKAAIKAYFEQLAAQGMDRIYEAKLLIVGEGGAGKTTLAKKIQDENYPLDTHEASTEGIDVVTWTFPLPEHLREAGQYKDFRVNIWDFGGQEIYHATHQFFLTKRSLYVLVADTRREDTDFYYWLNVVELLSENSPVLVIKNEMGDRHRDINENMLRGEFSNLEKILATNLATKRGLPEILIQIKHHISGLEHIGSPLPKTWVKVREALENDARNHITLIDYLTICKAQGFEKQEDSLKLSNYLHDLGVCLHFQQDALLNKTVILKPEWGTNAVYKVLDNPTVIRNQGRFTHADLDKIWHEDKYDNMHDELLQLMINFQLCYQISPSSSNSSKTYIAPQLLSENQPQYEWDTAQNLILRYTYEFMPKGIITRFIVIMHTHIINQDYVWKSGVILEKNDTQAEVIEYYSKREIKIRVVGKCKKELMTIITYEIDKIHDSYNKHLKYKKWIPCNCTVCKDSQKPYFFEYERLKKRIEHGIHTDQCDESYKEVNVLALIDDVIINSTENGQKDMKGNTIVNNYGTIQGSNLNTGDRNQQTIVPVQTEQADPEDKIIKKKGLDYQRIGLIAAGTIALAAVLTFIFKALEIF